MLKTFRFLTILFCMVFITAACSSKPITKAPEPLKDSQPDRANQPKVTAIGNEWLESAPEQQGIDGQMLSKADEYIKTEFPNIYSLVIIKNGYLVYEKYYLDKGKSDMVHVFSVTKSVTSSLIGIAVREGYLKSLDQKLADFYPEYFAGIDDPKKREITLKQALTMTAGFKPSDDNFYEWISSKSWFEYTIKQPLISQPGTKFNYDTGLSHLLSGVITRATKMNTLEFANKFLFSKIGIENKQWGTDNEGNYGGGHLLNLTPRDMAKFGYLYLKNGNWKGNQVVPEDWVRESTKKQVSFDKDSGYGYLWWVNNRPDSKRNKIIQTYSAVGYGGQRIDVIPELDIIAVITADPEKSPKNNRDTVDILMKFVIPSVK